MRVRKGGSGRGRERGPERGRRLKSSEANPVKRTHRDAARLAWAKAIPIDAQPALPIHPPDVPLLPRPPLPDHPDLPTFLEAGGEDDRDSVATRLTAFTNCTNPTFNRVHRAWKCAQAKRRLKEKGI